jgi:Zn-dependent peptidase ImmA (M78 family)/DNA-binding XRE family transcriptional regulator
MLEQISQKLIGYRVKAARETRKRTQEEIASLLGLKDRQSISDIETGKRALKSNELLALSDFLDRDLDYFIDPFAVSGEAKFCWRASESIPEESLDNFELKAGKWVGLIRWLREQETKSTSAIKPSLWLSADSTADDAQDRAEALAAELNLGQIPAKTLGDAINATFGIPVLFVDTIELDGNESVSGATCHLQDMCAILINRRESEGRRNFDLAHELFHALTWDALEPAHRESNSVQSRGGGKRIERLADSFAAALLMPRSSLAALIPQDRLSDVAKLQEVAATLRVSPIALAMRLSGLSLIDERMRKALAQKKQQSKSEVPELFSKEFALMLHVAIDKGRLSARKAAKTLDLGLSKLSALFSAYGLTVPFEL